MYFWDRVFTLLAWAHSLGTPQVGLQHKDSPFQEVGLQVYHTQLAFLIFQNISHVCVLAYTGVPVWEGQMSVSGTFPVTFQQAPGICLCPTSVAILVLGHNTQLFTQVLGIRTQVLLFVQQAFYPSSLSPWAPNPDLSKPCNLPVLPLYMKSNCSHQQQAS